MVKMLISCHHSHLYHILNWNWNESERKESRDWSRGGCHEVERLGLQVEGLMTEKRRFYY